MLTCLEYLYDNNGVMLYRCYGEGAYLDLPARVSGRPVTGLADHIFAKEPSWQLRNAPRYLAVQREEDGEWVEADPDALSGCKSADAPAGDALSKDECFTETACSVSADAPAGDVLTKEMLTDEALTGETLEEIYLPHTLRKIGNYAFYGCRKLHILSVPMRLAELGSGAFVDCNHLEQIWFTAEQPETHGNRIYGSGAHGDKASRSCTYGDGFHGSGTGIAGTRSRGWSRGWAFGSEDGCCMKTVIGEISYEVEAVVKDPEGRDTLRLLFPEYYEDSIENTPARIIIMKFEGSGYKYRQCFNGGAPDLKRYDALFPVCETQEFPETVMRLIADRLLFPVELEKAAAERMLAWMKANRGPAAAFCLNPARADEGIELLRILHERGFFEEEMLQYFLEQAGRSRLAEAVSVLMQFQETSGRVSYASRFRL